MEEVEVVTMMRVTTVVARIHTEVMEAMVMEEVEEAV